MMKCSSNLQSIQILRGLAAWMVVFHHFTQVYNQYLNNNHFSTFFTQYGAMGVDVFFVISGFVMYKSTTEKAISPSTFMFNRIARIVPAYWFYTFLTTIILLTINKLIPFTDFESIFLIKSLLFIPAPNPSGIGLYPILTVGWTLNYEMAFYLIFAGALLFRSKYQLYIIVLGIIVLQMVVPKIASDFIFYANKISFEFLLGIAVGMMHHRHMLKISLIPAIIATLACFEIISTTTDPHCIMQVGIPISIVVAITISQEHYFKLNKWLINLGDWSYSTYLCHVLILSIGFRLMTIWDLNIWIVLIICCLSIYVLSWASYIFVEQAANRLIKNNFVASQRRSYIVNTLI